MSQDWIDPEYHSEFEAPAYTVLERKKIGNQIVTTVVIDGEISEFRAASEMVEAVKSLVTARNPEEDAKVAEIERVLADTQDVIHEEDSLPIRDQYDVVLEEFRETIVDELYQRIETTGDVISREIELGCDTALLWELSGKMGVLFREDGSEEKDMQTAMYRAALFSLQIVNDVKSCSLSHLPLGEVLTADYDEMRAATKGTSQDYLARRPQIASLIHSFAPYIDSSYNYFDHVETMAGLMFMLCERAQARQ